MIGRRAALLGSLLALPGCSAFDDLFADNKDPLPGAREPVRAVQRGLEADPADARPITLPPPDPDSEWHQAGGSPSHAGGHPAAGGLKPAWRADIGEGGGYRRKITAQPVAAAGRVFAMDSDAVVSAHDLRDGRRLWRRETQGKKDRSTNVGGGLAWDNGVLYASTGRADVLALDAASGEIRWRKPLGSPARSAPTVAEGRVFVSTIDGRLVALGSADGEQAWSYGGTGSATTLLGLPAPAFADGLVVAGFGSGELVAVRADGGALAWSDTLASSGGRNSLADLSAVHARPVIDRGRVFAIGVGGLMLSLDLRSGRRLWERDVGGMDQPWLAGDWLFVLTSGALLAAIGREDGRVRWVRELPRFGRPKRQRDPIAWIGPVLAGNKLVLAGSNAVVVGVDPVEGKVVAQQELSAPVAVQPAAALGTLLVVTDDGRLQALR